MDAIKEAQVIMCWIAHNIILDSQIEGVLFQWPIIEKAGITPIGVYTHEPRAQAPLVIKEVNAIKVALLAPIPMVSMELSSIFHRKTIIVISQI